MSLSEELLNGSAGEVVSDEASRKRFSRDTSLFERVPSLVAYPKNPEEVSALVKAVARAKAAGEDVSITARSAGTDMSGGPLSRSLVAVFTKYMNKVLEVGDLPAGQTGGYAITEPGAYYRDFEKATLTKGYLLPSYPASRSIAAMGGIVNNNSGGERTLEYGKTEKYVEEVEVVLSDGTIATFKALGPDELAKKKAEATLEGSIYRRMSDLIIRNREAIEAAEPHVSKNSAGYALWSVLDTENGSFNLAKLICGAQGTLALMTKAKLSLVTPKEHRAMLVIYLPSDHGHTKLEILPEIVRRVLPFNPESFESYDDHTLSLAVRFMPQMLMQMGLMRAIRLGFAFIPDIITAATGGLPKLILMAEFAEHTREEADKRAFEAKAALADLGLPMRIEKDERASEKYWIVRRESFALLRKNLSGLYAAPFIDDFVVPPDTYPEFLPQLDELLKQYNLVYTIAGHIGNGNFHIIPLMDLSSPKTKEVVLELAPKVYDLVIRYGGTTTGEHNDGIIRTPYLGKLFGSPMTDLFKETKLIFDPLNIFNPGKKVGGTFADIERDMLTSA